MKTIDRPTMQGIVDEIKATAHNFEDVRLIVNSKIDLCDLIPREFCPVTLKIVRLMYNPDDKGKDGKHKESRMHVYNLINHEGAEAVPFREFFAHKHGKTDLLDEDGKPCEIKSGTGNWLYCEEQDFDSCIRMYRRKRTLIVWDYVRPDKGIDLHIKCTYAKLFDYLATYAPDKGLSTWFTRGGVVRNGLNVEYVWKMQEIMTSGKKIKFLHNCPYNRK